MPDFSFIGVILFIFAIINFFDYIFKSCMFFPYMQFLEDTGITIKPLGVAWETKRFNRTFRQLSQIKPSFLRSCYQVGVFFTIMGMAPAFCVVAYSFWQSFEFPTQVPQTDVSEVIDSNFLSNLNSPILMPIIPGFTLPLSQIPFYICTLLMCMIIHEMGHAIAAARENVTIERCGIALYGMFPVAYVKLARDQIQHLLPGQLLRIYSAGVWHNLVLSGFALLLMWTNPITLSPAFQFENGVTVVSVKTDSGLGQPGGLVVNDEIFNINDCKIKGTHSWEDCLKKFHAENNQGFCASSNFIKMNNIQFENMNASICCPVSDDHLCFQDMDAKTHFCLPGRKLVENTNVCYDKKDCGSDFCVIPIFPLITTRFLKMERNHKTPILYVGSIPDLKRSVTVIGWTAKFKAIPVQYVDFYETILVYIVTFSCGLAIMNLVPCYNFDGGQMTEIIVQFYLVKFIRKAEHRRLLVNVLNSLGCFVALGAVVCGVRKYVK